MRDIINHVYRKISYEQPKLILVTILEVKIFWSIGVYKLQQC